MTDDKLLSVAEVGAFFGGAGKPLAKPTIWRWVREGRVPKPIKIGAHLSRWRQSECQEALDAMIAASKEAQ